jgi:hypothetical protein
MLQSPLIDEHSKGRRIVQKDEGQSKSGDFTKKVSCQVKKLYARSKSTYSEKVYHFESHVIIKRVETAHVASNFCPFCTWACPNETPTNYYESQ